jgi:hypothetical protein
MIAESPTIIACLQADGRLPRLGDALALAIIHDRHVGKQDTCQIDVGAFSRVFSTSKSSKGARLRGPAQSLQG